MRIAARLAAVVLLGSVTAHAAGPPSAGSHPRMLLDPPLRAAWQAQAHVRGSPAARAIDVCGDAATTDKYDRALYQGSEWAKVLQACLVAWAATGEARHQATSLAFFSALLDDLDVRGDRHGGDRAAWRDSGYAIRNLGPYTALAYDWLYDQMSPQLRAHARQRWAAWLGWYADRGYRARAPGNNYHAGYLIAATLIAVAQAGEGDPALWTRVADELWGKDMAAALAAGGILEGGDWAEGWQYGPLSVAEYALAARVIRRAGVPVAGIEPWLAGVLRRHVYALAPGDRLYAGGDTEDDAANLAPSALTLAAVALGDARADDRRWALGEIARLHLAGDTWLLYDALAAAAGEPAEVPRMTWPTWYEAAATGTLYARTRWDRRAVWFVASCQHGLDVDHRHPDAGNFVLSRGVDDVIVDPSPYGSQSTLTSNAPAIASARLPAKYAPSQGVWSTETGWAFAAQTRSGVVAARCDYADQFRFQERRTDIAEAVRDLVVVPSSDGAAASVIVIDRAATGADRRAMFLRFRVPGELAQDGDVATRTIGETQLAITSVARSSGRPVLGRTAHTDCYADDAHKGRCDAARFAVTDLRLELDGPAPSAVHVISAVAADGAVPRSAALTGEGWAGVRTSGPRDTVVVWPTGRSASLTYRAPRAIAVTHVVLTSREPIALTARADGDACVVSAAGGGAAARPAVAVLDDACRVELDPATASAAAALGPRPPAPPRAATRHRRWGCSAGEPIGGASALASIALLVALRWARRRRSGR